MCVDGEGARRGGGGGWQLIMVGWFSDGGDDVGLAVLSCQV